MASVKLASFSDGESHVRVGKVLPAKIPGGHVVEVQLYAGQILRLIAGCGIQLLLGEAAVRRVIKRCAGHDRAAEVRAAEPSFEQVRVY